MNHRFKNTIELENFRAYQTCVISDLVQLWYHIDFITSLKTHEQCKKTWKKEEWCELVCIFVYYKLTLLCSLYRMNRGGKSETEITNYLTNLIFTRGMITTNSLNCTYNSSSWKSSSRSPIWPSHHGIVREREWGQKEKKKKMPRNKKGSGTKWIYV